MAKVPDPQVLADLDATFAWAAKSGRGDAKRQGITGFCWGGRIVTVRAIAPSRRTTVGAACKSGFGAMVSRRRR